MARTSPEKIIASLRVREKQANMPNTKPSCQPKPIQKKKPNAPKHDQPWKKVLMKNANFPFKDHQEEKKKLLISLWKQDLFGDPERPRQARKEDKETVNNWISTAKSRLGKSGQVFQKKQKFLNAELGKVKTKGKPGRPCNKINMPDTPMNQDEKLLFRDNRNQSGKCKSCKEKDDMIKNLMEVIDSYKSYNTMNTDFEYNAKQNKKQERNLVDEVERDALENLTMCKEKLRMTEQEAAASKSTNQKYQQLFGGLARVFESTKTAQLFEAPVEWKKHLDTYVDDLKRGHRQDTTIRQYKVWLNHWIQWMEDNSLSATTPNLNKYLRGSKFSHTTFNRVGKAIVLFSNRVLDGIFKIEFTNHIGKRNDKVEVTDEDICVMLNKTTSMLDDEKKKIPSGNADKAEVHQRALYGIIGALSTGCRNSEGAYMACNTLSVSTPTSGFRYDMTKKQCEVPGQFTKTGKDYQWNISDSVIEYTSGWLKGLTKTKWDIERKDPTKKEDEVKYIKKVQDHMDYIFREKVSTLCSAKTKNLAAAAGGQDKMKNISMRMVRCRYATKFIEARTEASVLDLPYPPNPLQHTDIKTTTYFYAADGSNNQQKALDRLNTQYAKTGKKAPVFNQLQAARSQMSQDPIKLWNKEQVIQN